MTATRETPAGPEVDARQSARGCPVCDARRVKTLHAMRFILPEGHPLVDRYEVVSCLTCGFVFADTESSQSDYDVYYADSSKYSDARTSTGAGVQDWDDGRLELTARTIARHLPDRHARIVDIGCANGGLLRWFGRLGFDQLEGIDPSPACVAAAEVVPNVTARVGSLFRMPAAHARAACAIVSHVLEHVRDLAKAVDILRSVVRDDGIVYVEVPDATRYGECLVAPFQDFNIEHINHFSPTSLGNALRRGGFVIEAAGQKTIEASRGVPYPAVWAIARAALVGDARDRIEFDATLGSAILQYISASRAQLERLDAHLDRALRGVDEVIVWGTGQTTLTLLSNTRLGGAAIAAFTDSNPVYHGRRLAGRPVVPPEDVAALGAPILIGSVIHRAAIADRIRELGLPNQVLVLDGA